MMTKQLIRLVLLAMAFLSMAGAQICNDQVMPCDSGCEGCHVYVGKTCYFANQTGPGALCVQCSANCDVLMGRLDPGKLRDLQDQNKQRALMAQRGIVRTP